MMSEAALKELLALPIAISRARCDDGDQPFVSVIVIGKCNVLGLVADKFDVSRILGDHIASRHRSSSVLASASKKPGLKRDRTPPKGIDDVDFGIAFVMGHRVSKLDRIGERVAPNDVKQRAIYRFVKYDISESRESRGVNSHQLALPRLTDEREAILAR